MAGAPVVTFLTNEDVTFALLIDQVRKHLGGLVQAQGYSLESGFPPYVDSPVIVATTERVLDAAKAIISPAAKTIIARRGVDSAKLKEVLALPKGTRVAVVSRDLEAAQETAHILQELGMDHLEYLPWVPGLSLPATKTAVTPGATHLVPSGIEHVIDLGLRPMDVSTLVEIVLACGLPTDLVNSISLEYVRAMVRLNQRLSLTVSELEESNARLETLIGFLDEGVAYIDREGAVRVSNRAVQDMVGVSQGALLGKQLGAVIGGETIKKALSSGISAHGVEVAGSREVSVSVIPVHQDEEVLGAICVLRDVSAVNRLEQEIVRNLRSGYTARYMVRDIYGGSPATARFVQRLAKIARTDLTVLVAGESGVGKEVAAQAIHNLSCRKNGPFVAVNFAAMPETLAESELFGYEEGAFTGARRGGHRGYFEEAHKGTIFLDEIGDASLTVQASLLRVLEEKRITRVGGTRGIPLDFRVIAATNRSLKEMVAAGMFRRDLYYRLNVLNLSIPPLRDRKEDIPGLFRLFFSKSGPVPVVRDDVLAVLTEHDWPGNVRELENVVSHIASIYNGAEVTVDDLPETLFSSPGAAPGEEQGSVIKGLEALGDMRLFLEVLECLERHSGSTGVGRQRICREISSRYGEHTVRRYLRYLGDVGACAVGSTRRGTRITAQGVRLLGQIRRYLAASNSPIPS